MSKQRKAFTLVELLVVIAIIGILFVVLISKVDFATEKSKATGVQTDFRSYQVAIETVARENAGLSVLVDADATGAEKYAELEKALNKNLDPKLHVEIDADGKISTEAKDPWKEQYLGAYLAPDEDGAVKDRGAIVMYSKGSNLKLGTTAATENGVVNVTIESGKETEGADDYLISTIYTYVNGYGEIQTATKGFSNNQNAVVSGNVTNSNPSDPDQDGSGNQEPVQLVAGLYDANGNLVADWDTLVDTHGLEITSNLTQDNYKTTLSSGYSVFSKPELSAGVTLVLPSDVTTIGEFTFAEAPLEEVVFNDGLTKIGGYAFYFCSTLKRVNIPATTTTLHNSLFGSVAFYNCYNLESIEVHPDNTKYHSDGDCLIDTTSKRLLVGCKNSIIPDDGSVEAIGRRAFITVDMPDDFTIPASIKYIYQGAFMSCTGMKTLRMLGVQDIADFTFQDCEDIETVYWPASITKMAMHAFTGCDNISSVYLEDITAWCKINFGGSTHPIYHGGDIYINGVKTVDLVIPNDISILTQFVFYNAKLDSITLGENVGSIGKYALSSPTLKTIISLNITPPTVSSYGLSGLSTLEAIYVPNESVDAYKTATGWSDYADLIKPLSEKPAE